MVSSTEVWLAGDPVNPGEPSVFLYWDGIRWAPPRDNAPLNVRVKDIDMLDSSFGWAVAQEGNAVAKYDSFSGYWSANPTCPVRLITCAMLASSPMIIFLVGMPGRWPIYQSIQW